MVKNLLERAWEYKVETYLILIEFQSSYDSIYDIIKFFAIPNKFIRLIKAKMNDSTYHVKM